MAIVVTKPKDLYGKIKQKLLDPSLTSHYLCDFTPPNKEGINNFFKAKGLNYSQDQELIQFSCCEASLPGASIMTNEINDDHTGVTERHAYRRQYDDRSDFSFYVDKDYTIIKFFEAWVGYVVGENDQGDLIKRDYFYRSYFPEDYQTDNLYITKFERDYKSTLQYQFIGAYPISISSMPVSYEGSQVLKCTVSFTYIRYLITNNTIQSDSEPKPSNQALQGTSPVTPEVVSSVNK